MTKNANTTTMHPHVAAARAALGLSDDDPDLSRATPADLLARALGNEIETWPIGQLMSVLPAELRALAYACNGDVHMNREDIQAVLVHLAMRCDVAFELEKRVRDATSDAGTAASDEQARRPKSKGSKRGRAA